MVRNDERLKELLILTECYRKMIKNKQMTEQDLKGAMEAVRGELEGINKKKSQIVAKWVDLQKRKR